ncbi:MAG: NAD(P)-binding protein, partial [Microcoleus sp. Co-bin12]|nr:NAD(P)-binding protein [Microcoleus sp. Co-bin12]
MKHYPVAIVGAGPAGLTAAYELVKQGIIPVVLEKGDKVGGIARTEAYKGYRFDIGGHRFYTKVEAVQQLWQEVLGNEFIKVPRLSRIFYRGKFFNYPISAFNTLFNLGIIESTLIILSYLKVRIWPLREEKTFEQWVINRFGERLYKTFFKTYTEKVWGIPCTEIQADWAAQRIKGLSLTTAIINALFGSNDTKTLIKEFDYPALGPGMMWEKFAEAV